MESFGFDVNQRPKPGETTEDLVQLQSQFLEARKANPEVKPAAAAVRIQKTHSPASSVPAPSSSQAGPELDDSEAFNSSCFTGRIVEKSTTQPTYQSTALPERKSKFKTERQKGEDPESKHLKSQPKEVPGDVMKKIQTSYDLFDPFKKANDSLYKNQSTSSERERKGASGCDSSIGEKIHPLLAGFTETDILQARESLLASMKPETKEILAKRRAAAEALKVAEKKQDSKSTPERVVQIDESLTPEKFKNFPHMETVENDKLEWTKPIASSDADSTQGPSERAGRFGLDGRLMTKELESDPSSWNKGLHHHGEEMDRPGYTIEELFTLSRSTFPHQRTFGLNVLAQIFRRAHDGEFDFALDTSIFQACNELDFVHVLRTGADLRDSLTINASIDCLAALLFPEQEELCLDIAFNWPNAEPFPWLTSTVKSAVEQSTKDEDLTESDLKDFQIVKNDLLEFLVVRTDIVLRFNYLLTDKFELLNESGVEGMLKILIRIARHSPNAILAFSDLLHNIQIHYMSPNWSQIDNRPANMAGVPLALAVKLFRILASSSLENATTLCNEFYLFPAILSYLAFNEWGNQKLVLNVEFLVLESSNLWEIFLNHGLGIQEYMSFFPMMMTSFQSLLNRDILPSFDLTYAARLHSLLTKALKVSTTMKNPEVQYTAFRESIGFTSLFVVKMLSLLGRESTSQLLDQDLCLLAILKGLECLTLARQYQKFPAVDAAVLKFVGSPTYRKITQCLKTHSFLLFHKHEPSSDPEKEKLKYPSNMSMDMALLFGGFQTPVLDKGSPFAFITTLCRYANEPNLKELILNEDCKAYLTVLGSTAFPIRINTFLRFELYCVHELLKLLPVAERLLPVSKILPLVQTGDEPLGEELFQMFVNCTGVAEPEVLIAFYSKFLFMTTIEQKPYIFRQLNAKVLSNNWLLEPLNVLYASATNQNQGKSKETASFAETVKLILRNGVQTTLEFVIFCLNNCPSVILPNISRLPAFYTTITLVFMMENQLFLEPHIRNLLKSVLELLISSKVWIKAKNKQVFPSNKKLDHLPTTLVNFYAELLEAFASNSFGDEVFGAFLMLPVRTGEDAQIKSLFWNEQSLRFLRTSVQESLISLEYFTSVPETNADLLLIFTNALRSKRIVAERNPLLYTIINFHLTSSNEADTNS